MKIKNLLKIIIFFIILVLASFSISIFLLLENYEKSLKKTDFANSVVLKVFERKTLADEYVANKIERSKIQWLSKQADIQNSIASHENEFTSKEEKDLIERIKKGLMGSKEVFDDLIEIYSVTPSATASGLLAEKETRIIARLGLKAQETISPATNLARINSQNVRSSLRLIILVFSVASLIFLVLLIVSFWIIWRVATKLDEANIKLQSLDKLKSEFVSIASHELRTPMTAIKGLVSMIFEGDYGKLPASLKEPLRDIGVSTERLITLVNDLLNLSRIEAGRTKFTIIDTELEKIITEVISVLQPLAKQKNIVLSSHNLGQIEVAGDSEKIQQILNNVIGNALKFTDSGSIAVSTQQEGELAKIFITDTGIGISTEDQKKLFGKFQQVSGQKTGRPAGTGLGLYISRELTRKMGGDLWIEKSEVGRGTTFAFSLPLAKSGKAATIKKAIEEEASQHPDQK